MNISQFETQGNHALLEIQRAQRVLDQTEEKMKKFRQEKKLASSNQKQINSQYQTQNSYPNIKQYLAYFLNQEEEIPSRSQQLGPIKSTTQIKSTQKLSSSQVDNQINNYKKTEKQMLPNPPKYTSNGLKNLQFNEDPDNFDIKKHTQQQLQRSQLVYLEHIENYYKESCELIDKKMQELEKNRDKIRKDKVLLLRDNEQLQQKIQSLRKKRQQFNEHTNPQNELVNKLNGEISKLQKKLAQIQMQNNKIIKRKQDLQTNMRVCIRNNKEHLQGDLTNLGLHESKSKSVIHNRCPYH